MKMSANKSADIFIYGEITKYAWEEYGEVSSITFKKDLDELGDIDTINLHINSPGGSVFEGIAIFNMLKMHKAKINAYIEALAASIASVIPMCADKVYMHKNSMMMVHHAWTWASGNAQELRKAADDIEKISKSACQTYLDRAGNKLTEKKLEELLDAETWLSADEAFSYGLCDEVLPANEAAASISASLFAQYSNVPQSLIRGISQQAQGMTDEEKKLRNRIAAEAKAGAAYIETILGGMYK
ncbi:head maturation protease, ClpP-related [Paenibacillus lentus]|uniref:head maturation protease, ClpP-related n=1 Tax=Paenibacillus lentus TaxID=1338368 RepID=UPI0036602723